MSDDANHEETRTEENIPSGVPRRQFIARSAIAVAGASAAMMATASTACAQKADSEASGSAAPVAATAGSVDVDTSARWKTRPGDLYNEKRGYGDEDVTGYKGRYVYGPTVGVVQLPANIPMLPGDMGNPTTFNFPVLYELLEGVDPFWVLSKDPHPVVQEKLIAACKKLTMQGVRTIIGNCGFFANYQPAVAKVLDPAVNFFNGSLIQLPMLLAALGSNKKVGVMTANSELLIPSPALKYCGVRKEDMDRVVIYGAQKGEQMNNITGEKGRFNPKAFEKELVDLATKMIKEHPDVGAVVLECTEFPPYAHAIQNAIRRNVWDFVTMTNFMHAGAMRTPYTGWML